MTDCQRGNGDGLPLNSWERSERHRFCQCAPCRANRWVAREKLLGRLTPEQEKTARDLIELIAVEPETHPPGRPSEEDDEEEDFS